MKIKCLVFFFCIELLLFSGEAAGLRKIKTGEKIPTGGVLSVFNEPGNKLILYVKSGDTKSVAFLKAVARTLESKQDILKEKTTLTLFLVDGVPSGTPPGGTDPRFTALLDALKIPSRVIPDGERAIYGELGVIIVPSLLFVDDQQTLHSLTAGLRSNLDMFLRENLQAMTAHKKSADVYLAAEVDRKDLKVAKLLNQAFKLMMNNNYELAASMYGKALEMNPKNIEAQLGAGYALLFMEKIDAALNHFTSLIPQARTDQSPTVQPQAAPDKQNKRVELGYLLCKALKSPDEETLTHLAQSALMEPNFFMVVCKAADILDQAGKHPLSSKVYQRAYHVLLRKVRRSKLK